MYHLSITTIKDFLDYCPRDLRNAIRGLPNCDFHVKVLVGDQYTDAYILINDLKLPVYFQDIESKYNGEKLSEEYKGYLYEFITAVLLGKHPLFDVKGDVDIELTLLSFPDYFYKTLITYNRAKDVSNFTIQISNGNTYTIPVCRQIIDALITLVLDKKPHVNRSKITMG